MKITSVESILLTAQLKQPFWSAGVLVPNRNAVLVMIHTDEGITGLGEAFCMGGPPHTTLQVIQNDFKHLLVGEDPRYTSYLWEKLYKASFMRGRRGIIIAALSGVDIALWDIMGKISGLPIYRLLGGFRNKVMAYATGGHYAEGKGLPELQKEVIGYIKAGFKAIKIKVGKMSIPADIDRVKAVREAIGNDVQLMVDANRAYDAKNAIKLARGIEKYNISWLEEPVSPDHVDASIRVAEAIDIPVCGYETEATAYAFRELISKGAVDIVQQDVSWSGGFTECRRVADIAYAWGLRCIPHSFGSAVTVAANLHFLASLPNGDIFEFDQNPNDLRDKLLINPIQIDIDGYITIPEKPGLGIELSPESVEQYRGVLAK